jgi:hypothetical protein
VLIGLVNESHDDKQRAAYITPLSLVAALAGVTKLNAVVNRVFHIGRGVAQLDHFDLSRQVWPGCPHYWATGSAQ